MVDLKFIRENPEKIKDALQKRGVFVDIDRLLESDRRKRKLGQQLDICRSEQKTLSGDRITEARSLKSKIKKLEQQLRQAQKELEDILLQIPNIPQEDVPVGRDGQDNVVVREVGEKRKFDFPPRGYLEIAEQLDIIDVKRAAKVSGSRFGYLKGAAAHLEFALVRFAFDELSKEGFIAVVPPVLIREDAMRGMGYIDTESDRAERYFLEKDKLYLVGTSEQALGPMHRDEIFEERDLPRRYVGFSSCFREEAGSYGKETKGILRVHQFDKVEMFSFAHPAKSREEHLFMAGMAENLMKKLEIPFRVVQLCTGDLGRVAAVTYDIESWLPSEERYFETHSISNCTDFQARRLNIRYRSKDGKLSFVHMLNGTAFAIGRTLVAIIENYQQKDGTVNVPKVLEQYMGSQHVT